MQVRDAGNLLTRAGLNIPSVDVDEITVQYKSPDELISHLRWVIATNANYLPLRSLRKVSKVLRYMLHVTVKMQKCTVEH